eukprot:jgi/Tetstr1/430761/TSEL_020546.t1
MLPYLDDLLFFAELREAAYALRPGIDALLDRFGLICDLEKGHWESTQVGEYLGLELVLKRGEFRVLAEKLATLARWPTSSSDAPPPTAIGCPPSDWPPSRGRRNSFTSR